VIGKIALALFGQNIGPIPAFYLAAYTISLYRNLMCFLTQKIKFLFVK
jgi:hypothetical protein